MPLLRGRAVPSLLQLNDEEMTVLLELAAPIAYGHRHEFN
jgi:hypothetical protein